MRDTCHNTILTGKILPTHYLTPKESGRIFNGFRWVYTLHYTLHSSTTRRDYHDSRTPTQVYRLLFQTDIRLVLTLCPREILAATKPISEPHTAPTDLPAATSRRRAPAGSAQDARPAAVTRCVIGCGMFPGA